MFSCVPDTPPPYDSIAVIEGGTAPHMPELYVMFKPKPNVSHWARVDQVDGRVPVSLLASRRNMMSLDRADHSGGSVLPSALPLRRRVVRDDSELVVVTGVCVAWGAGGHQ